MIRSRFTFRRSGLFLVPLMVGATAMLALPALAAPGSKGGERACHHGQMHGKMHGSMARISVTGLGEAVTEPDLALINLGVTTQGATAGEALAQNSTQQAAVFEALRAAGIEDRDLQTSGLNPNPMRDYSKEGQPPVITGYQAQNMLTVRVRDLDRLGQTLDAIVGAGANEINGISFARQAADQVQDEARQKAVAAARHSAEVMAQAAGLALGPVLTISDSVSVSGPEPVRMEAMAMKDAGGAVPIAGGELTMTAMVQMQFALIDEARMGDCQGDGHGMQGQMGHDMPMDGAQEDGAEADASAPDADAGAPATDEAPAEEGAASN